MTTAATYQSPAQRPLRVMLATAANISIIEAQAGMERSVRV